VAPIIEGGKCELARRLKSYEATKPLRALEALHCGSFSIVDDDLLPPHLVFEVSFDGTREDFVDDLVTQIPGVVDNVFKFCEDYPETGTTLPQVTTNYLLDRDVGADALYIGFPGRTVDQIREEKRLRDELVGTLDRIRRAVPPDEDDSTKRSLVNDLRRHV